MNALDESQTTTLFRHHRDVALQFMSSGEGTVLSLVAFAVFASVCLALAIRNQKAALREVKALSIILFLLNLSMIYHGLIILIRRYALYVGGIGLSIISMYAALRALTNAGAEKGQWSPMQLPLFPCRTTHTRLFPTKHSFSYFYLYVGIPIGWYGNTGAMLSADTRSPTLDCQRKRRTWFSVEAEDYLERGGHPDGLLGKLRDFLKS